LWVVGEVIDIIQPRARRTHVFRAQPVELGVIGRTLGAVAVDEIEQTAADAFDGGNVERFLRRRNVGGLRAK
jgi:hypothetical protein